jgi:ribosome-associated toxin RatA of RatAB toxin-antitoxin module
MPHVEVTETVVAPRARVYEVCCDMESFPRFMPDVKGVKTLERGPGFTVTEWDTRVKGRPFKWTERDTFDAVNHHIDFKLVKGDIKRFDGFWQLDEVAGGTKVTLVLEFDFGVPMLAALLDPVARLLIKGNFQKMLSGLKEQLESQSGGQGK